MSKEVNLRIKKLRKKAKITQEEMGEKLGIKRSTYAHIEAYGNFKAAQLKIIAQVFGQTVDQLIDGDNFVVRASKNFEPPQPMQLRQTENSYNTPDKNILDYITANEKKLVKSFRNLTREEKDKVIEFINNFKSTEN